MNGKVFNITVEMLDKNSINYDWQTLYVGISVSLIECRELTAYAFKVMEDSSYKDGEFINQLAWGIDDYSKEELLTKMLLKFKFDKLVPESEKWNHELRKLRYIILNYLKNTINDDKELLDKIEEVYADFNYPQDMNGFIAYMPTDDYIDTNSIVDNRKRLVKKLENFLILEKKELSDNNK